MGLFKSLKKRVRGLAKLGSAPLRAGAKLAGKLPGGKAINRAVGKIPGAKNITGGSLAKRAGRGRMAPGRAMAGRPGGFGARAAMASQRTSGMFGGSMARKKPEGGY